ncbi:MAG: hypothetical protein LH473_07090 [Chitinophagales bacterium]|nr:hypothetical protein [Chitinophagales bacterium]
MKHVLQFHIEAEIEFTEAVLWYEEKKAGLGDEFLDAVEAKLKLIDKCTELFPFDDAPIRKVVLKRFPFSIFYEFDASAKNIYVIEIFHSKRNLKVLKNRM